MDGDGKVSHPVKSTLPHKVSVSYMFHFEPTCASSKEGDNQFDQTLV